MISFCCQVSILAGILLRSNGRVTEFVLFLLTYRALLYLMIDGRQVLFWMALDTSSTSASSQDFAAQLMQKVRVLYLLFRWI